MSRGSAPDTPPAGTRRLVADLARPYRGWLAPGGIYAGLVLDQAGSAQRISRIVTPSTAERSSHGALVDCVKVRAMLNPARCSLRRHAREVDDGEKRDVTRRD